jgi:hypothetical protein
MSQMQFTITTSNYLEKLNRESNIYYDRIHELDELRNAIMLQVEEYTELFNCALNDYFNAPMITRFIKDVLSTKLNPMQHIMEDWYGKPSYPTRELIRKMGLSSNYLLYSIKNKVKDLQNNALAEDNGVRYKFYEFVEFKELTPYLTDDTIETFYNRYVELEEELNNVINEISSLLKLTSNNEKLISDLNSYSLTGSTKITITI